jgi:hypothetical protein
MLRLLFLLVFVGLLSSPLWVPLLALEDAPHVRPEAALSIDDVANAKRLLSENDPRTLRDGEQRQVTLSERELNLMLGYGLPEGRAAQLRLAPGRVHIRASARVPDNPVGRYLNVELDLLERGGELIPGDMSAGRLRLPAFLVKPLARVGSSWLASRFTEYQAALDALDAVHVGAGSLTVFYRWRAALAEQVWLRGRDLMLSPEQGARILDYYTAIAALSRTLPSGASLADLLAPLFAKARARSSVGEDPAAENRALLIALGMAAQGRSPSRLIAGSGGAVPSVRRLGVKLRGRGDLAQHFTISAALAVSGGSELADVIGVFKELSDSQGGSGFSFADLLADRAGVVFAEQTTGPSAARLQRALAGQIEESLFMPHIDRLPEGLQELEFRSRYEDLDTETYTLVQREIERRIGNLALYR